MKISSAKITLVLSLLVISVLLVACNVAESTEQIAILVPENTLTTVPPAQTEISITPTNPPDEPIESSPPESSIDQVIAGLEGLPIDEFFDESYKQILLREPEVLTYAHLSQEFGLRDDQLNDLSDAYLRQTQQLEAAILDLLRTHDREQLTPDQQLSYDIYEWDLDTRVRGHQFMYNDYPLTHFIFRYEFA